MRITQNRPVNETRRSPKRTGSSTAGAVFSVETHGNLPKVIPTSQANTSMPMGDVSALLAVQGDDQQKQRSAAVSRGYETLDALDSLKVDVLSGQVSRQKLVHLARLVDKQRQTASDPALMNVLDHIELRARVELAKFEQNRQ